RLSARARRLVERGADGDSLRGGAGNRLRDAGTGARGDAHFLRRIDAGSARKSRFNPGKKFPPARLAGVHAAMKRRDFLALSGAATLAAAAGRLYAAPGDARLLLVFLRGGYDAANVLVPISSRFYFEARPSIAIRRGE